MFQMLTCVTRSSVRKMSSCVAAVVQMRVTSSVDQNLEQAAALVTRARQRGASMVFLPEACDFIGENREQSLSLSQTIDGSTVARFR